MGHLRMLIDVLATNTVMGECVFLMAAAKDTLTWEPARHYLCCARIVLFYRTRIKVL